HHPVALREQCFERRIGCSELALFRRRQRGALVIENSHPERRRPDRDLPADLAQADDAEGGAVERAQAGNARPVRVGRVAAVERFVGVAGFAQLIDADAAEEAMKFLGEREHQRDGELGQAILARRRMVSTLMPLAAQAAVSMLRGLRPYFCTTRSSPPAASSSLPTRSDSTTRAELPGKAARISLCVSTSRTSRGKSLRTRARTRLQ